MRSIARDHALAGHGARDEHDLAIVPGNHPAAGGRLLDGELDSCRGVSTSTDSGRSAGRASRGRAARTRPRRPAPALRAPVARRTAPARLRPLAAPPRPRHDRARRPRPARVRDRARRGDRESPCARRRATSSTRPTADRSRASRRSTCCSNAGDRCARLPTSRATTRSRWAVRRGLARRSRRFAVALRLHDANRPAPVVEEVEDVALAELDPHRTAARRPAPAAARNTDRSRDTRPSAARRAPPTRRPARTPVPRSARGGRRSFDRDRIRARGSIQRDPSSTAASPTGHSTRLITMTQSAKMQILTMLIASSWSRDLRDS